ncbi:cutinase family protein [Aeromicrobium terrae]|uniref:cutinase family protein n=1 Tax=Aeromicrobium terrae TaxID=2498846 RepID=UPI00164F642B|nr:cutinase family protein [Aeromicrobium terrae]
MPSSLRSLAALLLTAGLLAGCDRATSSPEQKAAHLTSERCADLVVIGARGQAQTAKNVGGEIIATTTALVDALPDGTSVRLEGLRYDASITESDAEYERHEVDGARRLVDRIDELADACPRSRLVLIGFSAGAEVVHRAVADLTEAGPVAVAAMIGDPLRNPDDRITDESYGTGRPEYPGYVGRGEPVSPALRDRTITFCVMGDEVCSSPEPARSVEQSRRHKEFYEQPEHARETARVMVDVLDHTLKP